MLHSCLYWEAARSHAMYSYCNHLPVPLFLTEQFMEFDENNSGDIGE